MDTLPRLVNCVRVMGGAEIRIEGRLSEAYFALRAATALLARRSM